MEEDRRFATDPKPAPTEVPVTATSVPTATYVVTPTLPVQASPDIAPFEAAPRAEIVYSLVDDTVVATDTRTGIVREIARSSETSTIELIEPSRDGSTVAILFARSGEQQVFDLQILRADGSAISSLSGLSDTLGAGSGKNRGALAADWDTDGRRLAIVFPDGGGIVVDLEGGVTVLLTRAQAPAPLEVAWSPDGEAIAFTSRDLDDDSPFLAIGGVRVLPLDPVRIAGTGGLRPIHAVRWQPDGDSLVAVQGSGQQLDRPGGDLIEVDRGTLTVRFALGGSRFGPGHAIVLVEPAPEGQAWAIVTISPGPRGGLQATVWQAGPVLTEATRLPLGENPPVAGVTWTAAGLTVTLHDAGEVRLVTFDLHGQPIAMATPVASPVASPVPVPIIESATPQASPLASPET